MPCSQKFVILLMKPLSNLFCYLQFPFIFCLGTIHCSISIYREMLYIRSAKFNDHTTQLFWKMKIIKFVHLVSVENFIFINKCFPCKSYSVSNHLYNLATGRHNHQTRLFAMNGLLILPNCTATKFDTKAFLYSTITSWNSFQALFSEKKFRMSPNKPEKVILKNFPYNFEKYCFYHQFSSYNLYLCICICICFCMCI